MNARDAVRYPAEDDTLRTARRWSAELGCVPVGPETGAVLRFLAATLDARAVVELGTGTGVSGLWLLRGMAPDGVFTSIDVEPEPQRAARAVFAEAGFAGPRLRLINGMALDVLPRLTDAGYDLVFVDAVRTEYPRYLDEALRLLRPGGVVALHGVLADARMADAPADDADAALATLRDTARQCREDEGLVSMLLPVGGGLLVALRAGR